MFSSVVPLYFCANFYDGNYEGLFSAKFLNWSSTIHNYQYILRKSKLIAEIREIIKRFLSIIYRFWLHAAYITKNLYNYDLYCVLKSLLFMIPMCGSLLHYSLSVPWCLSLPVAKYTVWVQYAYSQRVLNDLLRARLSRG